MNAPVPSDQTGRSRLERPSGPGEEEPPTSQGRSYGIFQKAIQRRNVIAAAAAARELPQLSLLDALELTMLIARKDPRRHPRGLRPGGSSAYSRSIRTRRSRRRRWLRPASSRFPEPVTAKRRRP